MRRLTPWRRRMRLKVEQHRLCSVDGCRCLEEADGLCAGHRKRKTLGKPVDGELRPARSGAKRLTPWQLLEKATEDYWDCDVKDDQAFTRARQRLAYAARVFAAGRRRRG